MNKEQILRNYLDKLQTTVHIDGNFDVEVELVELKAVIEYIESLK